MKDGERNARAHPEGDTPAILSQVKRTSIVDTVTEKLIALIETGAVKAGETVPKETDLMEQLGVGRSTVREAVRSLVVMGVLESRARRGTIVVSPTINNYADKVQSSVLTWALRDLYEVRALLEGEAAAKAASHVTEVQTENLRKLCAIIEKRIESGKPYFEENRRFHLAVADASRNSVLISTIKSIIGVMREHRERIMREDPAVQPQDTIDHREIVDAIAAGDSDGARDAMRRHLYFAAQSVPDN